MKNVLLCAIGVGGATVIGTIVGFVFRTWARKYSGAITAIAAGVMLYAAFSGLIIPAFDNDGLGEIALAIAGLVAGAVCIRLAERIMPEKSRTGSAYSALLLAIAMAVHNLPEGIAAGLSFGGGSIGDAMAVTLGIALHNLPEGMITVFPMISAGMRPCRALILSLSVAAAEIAGTLFGYFASSIALPLLPFTLAFAGGTMLFVITSELLPENTAESGGRAPFLVILGACAMGVLGALIS